MTVLLIASFDSAGGSERNATVNYANEALMRNSVNALANRAQADVLGNLR